VDAPQELKGPALWHAHVILEAARAGQGLSLANMLLIRDDIATGRLVPVGPAGNGFPLPFGNYHFVARRDRWNDRNISKFRQWVMATAKEDLARETMLT
jgi:DNA-binding transcriptional LysR family regulator